MDEKEILITKEAHPDTSTNFDNAAKLGMKDGSSPIKTEDPNKEEVDLNG